MSIFLDTFLGELADARIGSETPTVASREAHTAWVRQGGRIVGYTVFSCGDRRLLILASGDENEAKARRFHARLLSSVSCIAGEAAPPATVYADLKLPSGFREVQRDPSELLYQRGAEQLMVSCEHRETGSFEHFTTAEGRDQFLGALVKAMGVRVDGAEQRTERETADGKRQFWSYRLSDSSRVTWTAWKCGDDVPWFLAMSTAEPEIAVERLLGASCPQPTVSHRKK